MFGGYRYRKSVRYWESALVEEKESTDMESYFDGNHVVNVEGKNRGAFEKKREKSMEDTINEIKLNGALWNNIDYQHEVVQNFDVDRVAMGKR